MFPFCHTGSFAGWGAWGWGGMIAGMLLWTALIIGIILLAVWLFRRASHHEAQILSGQPALEVLQARYARGEISREEYQRIFEEIK
jgi:putative membrane protein